MTSKKKLFGIKEMTQIGVLSAVAAILMYVDFPLWFAPPFYKLDFSEIPVVIGAFAINPLAGVFIELIKVLIVAVIKGSTTGGIGEIANFLIGISFVLPAAFIYHINKTKKSAVKGMLVGTSIMTIVGGVLNAFVLLPVYAKAFKMPIEALVNMGTEVNASITDLSTFVLLAVTPFNLLKGVLVTLITVIIYKKISYILKTNH